MHQKAVGRRTVGADANKEKTKRLAAQKKKRVPAKISKFDVPHLYANGSLYAPVRKKITGRKVDEYPQ